MISSLGSPGFLPGPYMNGKLGAAVKIDTSYAVD